MIQHRLLVLLFLGLLSAGCGGQQESRSAAEEPDWRETLAPALTFHASFDHGVEADYARGDRAIYTAPSYRQQGEAQPGLGNPEVSRISQGGRYGGALRFARRNTQAIFYRAEGNVAYADRDWGGSVSFWLSLTPEEDLEPGYCDPIQVTDENYNDAALWVDFTRDNPRQFRLGVFGDLAAWNPENRPPDENPDFQRRLVTVDPPPFSRDQWTHVVITFSGLNTEDGGYARLYLNGKLQGTTETIREPFSWEISRATLRLGLNYVGLMDELAVFNRPLNAGEVAALYTLENGLMEVHAGSRNSTAPVFTCNNSINLC